MSSPLLPDLGGALAPVAPATLAAPMAAPVTPAVLWDPSVDRPLTEIQRGIWHGRLDRAQQKAEQFHPQWERSLTNYTEAIVRQAKTDVDALLDYRHVESKKAQLFHRTPEVNLLPIDPTDPAIPLALLPLRQKFLNHELGAKGANLKRALHKTLVETLAASGWMVCELGFEQVDLPDPLTGAPAPIWSRRFIEPVSSKKLLIPDDFYDSSNYDAAPWLAVKGTTTVAKARRLQWRIPEGFEGTAQSDQAIFTHGLPHGGAPNQSLVEYTRIWYRAADEDPLVFNPELYRCLVFVTGIDEPVWHRDSPFQALTPQGALTDDSMIGNPIHVGTLRDLPDSAYVPSDLVIGEQLSTELNKFRTDLVLNRRSRRPYTLVSDAIGQEAAAKLLKDHGAVVPASHIQPGGAQDLVVVVQAGSEPRDNFISQDYIERDHEQGLGMSPNQQGQTQRKKTTATEARIVQGNASARAETEKDRIREYVVALVGKADALLQRTATIQELQKVLGQQGAALWEQWRALPGKYVYDILPDAGQWVDIHQARAEWLQKYELLRRDDRVNAEELLAEGARLWNRDPAKFIVPPKTQTMAPPTQSVSVNLMDLNDPVAGTVFLDLSANGGVKLSAETVALLKAAHIQNALAGAMGQPEARTTPDGHGGAALKAERLSKHQEDRTGAVQGVGVQ